MRQHIQSNAQAVGRAMRRWTDPDTGAVKQRGVVILPVVVPPGAGVEEHMSSGNWKAVWNTIAALRAVDDRLGDLLTTALVRHVERDGGGPPETARCPGCGNILLRSDSTCPWCDPVRPVGPVDDGGDGPGGGPGRGGLHEDGGGGEPGGGDGRGPICPGPWDDDPSEPWDDDPPIDGRSPEAPPPSTEPRIIIAGDATEVLGTLSLRLLEHSVASFEVRVRSCGEWAMEHGEVPSHGSRDPEEKRHGQWLSKCRTAARGGQGASAFTPERRALLDRYVPGWMGTDPEEAFRLNAIACGKWAASHGKVPSGGSKDPEEKRHGVWLGRCRGAARGGKGASVFTPERRALLDRYVPGWDADRDETFRLNAVTCGEWVKEHGKVPSGTSKDPEEKRHGQWLSKCRTAARGGKGASAFTPERRALLDRYVPGWDAPGSRRGRAA